MKMEMVFGGVATGGCWSWRRWWWICHEEKHKKKYAMDDGQRSTVNKARKQGAILCNGVALVTKMTRKPVCKKDLIIII